MPLVGPRVTPFNSGDRVVWRSRPQGQVGYVCACIVLQDEPDVVTLLQPTGAPIARRAGTRSGPRGRSLRPDEWDGSHEIVTWDYPPTVRLHPIGRPYAVIRTWLSAEACFRGWYVNLEQPWTRTPVGFDSRDLVLDVVISDDLDDCGLKDEDEFAFAIETGGLTEQEAAATRLAATEAMQDIAKRRWPFEPGAWAGITPGAHTGTVSLPPGWDES